MIRPNRAWTIGHNSDGQYTGWAVGSASGQDDTSMSSFIGVDGMSITYDAQGRPGSSSSAATGYVQYSYTAAGALQCSAQRMNSADFGSTQLSACDQGTGSADRIAKYTYDKFFHVKTVTTGGGGDGAVPEHVEISNDYDAFGRLIDTEDANGNRTSYNYDGMGRVHQIQYPSKTAAHTSNTADYEEFGYDADSNVTSIRTRCGLSFSMNYDPFRKFTFKNGSSYVYNNFGQMRAASNSNQSLTALYDTFGRMRYYTNSLVGTRTYDYYLDGRRKQITWPDGFYVTYDYYNTGDLWHIYENGVTTGAAVLAKFDYYDGGQRKKLTRGNGGSTTYGYSGATLQSLDIDLPGIANDQTITLMRYASNQISNVTRTNPAYAYAGYVAGTTSYGVNGLNQYSGVGQVSPTYDGNRNLTSAGGATYSYSADNKLTNSSVTSLSYDPLDRLSSVYSTGNVIDYDGTDAITEKSTAGQVARRYVFGPGTDEPLVWYEGAGTANRKYLVADERGSIIAVNGSSTTINRYDEHGYPAPTNIGRFQFTGQAWIPELGLYHYKARMYAAGLGRFLQPDPLRYGDGMNMYAYAGNDSLSFTDPSGLEDVCCTVTGQRPRTPDFKSIFLDFVWGDMHKLADNLPGLREFAISTNSQQEASTQETSTCRGIRERAEASRHNLSDYIANTRFYDNSSTLRSERAMYVMNVSEAKGGAILGGVGGFGTTQSFIAVLLSRGLAGPMGAAFFAYGMAARAEASYDSGVVDAIDDRLIQLQSIEDGTCSAGTHS